MAHSIAIAKTQDKADAYRSLMPQLEALCAGESNITANVGNVCAALKQTFQWWWVGVYWVVENVLVLGPFQGPVACTRIQYGKGVCGKAWQQEATILVPDVEKFEGHIACSSLSRSEIVIPIIKNNIVIGVLDVDSQWLHHFDETDAAALQDIAKLISDLC